MSNWLVTLAYHEKNIKNNDYQNFQNCYVKFQREYPTKNEIDKLIESYTEVRNSYDKHFKYIPIIVFMQKLEEVET